PAYSTWLDPLGYANREVPPDGYDAPYAYGGAHESFRLVWRRVLARSRLEERAKLVGRAISEHVDRTGDAPFRPLSHAEIARTCGRSPEWGRVGVRRLEEVGLLEPEPVPPFARGRYLFRLRLPRPALDAAFRWYLGGVRVEEDEDGVEPGRAGKRLRYAEGAGPGPAVHRETPRVAREIDPSPGGGSSSSR